MRRFFGRWALALGLVAALVGGLASRVQARPGGGQSYSGGSSRSGGGSSGGGSSFGGSSSSSSSSSNWGSGSGTGTGSSEEHPVLVIGLFLGMVLICGAVFTFGFIKSARDDRDMFLESQRRADRDARERRTDYVAMIRERDPEFSLALFEDFVRALFVRAHEARHDEAALARLAPYLSTHARQQLRHPAPVETVVIGALSVSGWNLNELQSRFEATVAFEANVAAGGETRLVRETWQLQRAARARTRPWQGVRTFGCPSCGAPLEQVSEERCASCGQPVAAGRFDWSAWSACLDSSAPVSGSLTATVPEQGTEDPTIVDSGLAAETAALLAADPLALTGFEARLQLIFAELNAAWAAQDLRPARPFLSGELFATLGGQIEGDRAQGLVNLVAGARITRWQPARLRRDARYDAFTIRLFGAGCDYTYRKETGDVVAGDKTSERPYSEYWTLIRGAKVRGAARADKACPQCAAPLDVGMEGNCEHCGALVASGDFDWVLSGIDQDEAYRG